MNIFCFRVCCFRHFLRCSEQVGPSTDQLAFWHTDPKLLMTANFNLLFDVLLKVACTVEFYSFLFTFEALCNTFFSTGHFLSFILTPRRAQIY